MSHINVATNAATPVCTWKQLNQDAAAFAKQHHCGSNTWWKSKQHGSDVNCHGCYSFNREHRGNVHQINQNRGVRTVYLRWNVY